MLGELGSGKRLPDQFQFNFSKSCVDLFGVISNKVLLTSTGRHLRPMEIVYIVLGISWTPVTSNCKEGYLCCSVFNVTVTKARLIWEENHLN